MVASSGEELPLQSAKNALAATFAGGDESGEEVVETSENEEFGEKFADVVERRKFAPAKTI